MRTKNSMFEILAARTYSVYVSVDTCEMEGKKFEIEKQKNSDISTFRPHTNVFNLVRSIFAN